MNSQALVALQLQPGDNLVGTTLDETFLLQRCLGAGTFGEVWLCQIEQGEQRAVKVVPFADDADILGLVKEFENGRRIAETLQGFHVPEFYGASPGRKVGAKPGVAINFLIIVMEYIDGKSVGDLVSKENPLPPFAAVVVIHDMIEVLWQLHENGIVHRDVKGANIIINRAGDAYLTDFGVTRILVEAEREMSGMEHLFPGSQTRAMSMTGTPLFMAPEGCHEIDEGNGMAVYDEKVDIWSLGIVGIQMATGETPNEANGKACLSCAAVQDQIIGAPAPQVSGASLLASGFPRAFHCFLERTLVRDPRCRSSAGDLRALVKGTTLDGLCYDQSMPRQTAEWLSLLAADKRAAGEAGWDGF